MQRWALHTIVLYNSSHLAICKPYLFAKQARKITHTSSIIRPLDAMAQPHTLQTLNSWSTFCPSPQGINAPGHSSARGENSKGPWLLVFSILERTMLLLEISINGHQTYTCLSSGIQVCLWPDICIHICVGTERLCMLFTGCYSWMKTGLWRLSCRVFANP